MKINTKLIQSHIEYAQEKNKYWGNLIGWMLSELNGYYNGKEQRWIDGAITRSSII